jgi:hypothetical protein
VVAAFQANAAVSDAATKLYLIHARTGSFPADFMTSLRKYLDTVKAAPHLGVWSPYKKGQVPEDYTALALWVNRDQPEYVRELLAARKGDGVQTWYGHDKPLDRPYLAEEKAALEWLALLTRLEPAEQAGSRSFAAKLRLSAPLSRRCSWSTRTTRFARTASSRARSCRRRGSCAT